MIRIDNIRTYTKQPNEVAIRIDRANPILGNMFKMKLEKDRDLVCEQYQDWFNKQITSKNEIVLKELRKIYKVALTTDVVLS